MTIISEKPLNTVFCVNFTYNKHKYYAYFQNLENAQRNAHRYLLSDEFKDVEISECTLSKKDDEVEDEKI